MKITNISKALQGVNVVGGGVVFIPPGEAREVDVAYEEREAVEKLPFFRIGDIAEADEVEGDDDGKVVFERAEFDRFKQAIDEETGKLREEVERRGTVVAELRDELVENNQTIASLREQLAASTAAQKPNDGDAAPVYSVKEKAAGWLVIVDANGAEVTKSLRKEAVDGFDAKSDEDKAAFVAANKPD